jgi:hypothetical protein
MLSTNIRRKLEAARDRANLVLYPLEFKIAPLTQKEKATYKAAEAAWGRAVDRLADLKPARR